MILLNVQNVKKSFGVREVLSGASLTLQDRRRLGLVGANGSGKSTLLKIIAGEESLDEGAVTMMRGLTMGYLAQQGMITEGLTIWEELEQVFAPVIEMERSLRRMEKDMAERHEDTAFFEKLSGQYASVMLAFEEADGYAWKSAVQGVLTGLGFPKETWHRTAQTLSGGERTRLSLGRQLLMKPDILLLDEPTNHLDLDALSWLEQYLSGFGGAVIIVSHDRYFLDAVCTDIAELFLGKIEQYPGNYTRYQILRAERMETRLRAYTQQRKEIERQQAVIDLLHSYNREKSVKRARSREKMLDKMERIEKPQEEKQVEFHFTARRRSGDDVLMAEGLTKGYDGRTLFEGLNLHVRAGDRIALIGPNGAGKSTLLKLLIKKEKPDAGTFRYGANVDIGYYDQHQQGLTEHKTVLDELWDDFPYMEQSALRGILGCFLFVGDDVFQPIRTLSGGERGRVALTRLLLRADNLLLLDEPTNHLDMDSREVLEQALEEFPGTLLTVSHDRYFINRLATRVLEMRPEGVTETLGNYDDYLEKKRRQAEGEQDEAPQATRTAIEKEKKRDKQAREAEKAERQRLEALEMEITRQEERIAKLEASLAEPDVYSNPQRAKEVALELRALNERLSEMYDEWAESV